MPFTSEKQRSLDEVVKKASNRFPKLFDKRLARSFHQLVGSSDDAFLEDRSLSHLRRLLLTQFLLQKRLESADQKEERKVCVHIFTAESRICIALALSYHRQNEIFNEQNILRAVQTFVPGIQEVPNSFYTWLSSKNSYLYCYLELQKLRGLNLSSHELKRLQANIENHIYHGVTSCCPPVFWPYNYEESYRQLISLQQEIQNEKDLPQVTIQFKEQTSSDLEFLIHLARPKSTQPLATQRLPSSVHFSSHLRTEFKTTEAFVFSLHIPTQYLHTNKAVNLLNARRYIVILLQEIIGPFRDFNGGLFTKQEDVFGKLKEALSQKIPDFNLFAEKVFYSLKPVERQFSLTVNEAEALFRTILLARDDKAVYSIKNHPSGILVIKAPERVDLEQLQSKLRVIATQFSVFNAHYLCLLNQAEEQQDQVVHLFKNLTQKETRHKTLKLNFVEGPAPSFSPLFLNSDLRSRCLSKLLFEGLIRFDEDGKPKLAGAEELTVSEDGLIYLIKLRLHHWSNGEQVTAYHYEKSWKQAIISTHSAYAEPFYVVKNAKIGCDVGIYALDSETLKIELETPDASFLKKLAQPLFLPDFEPPQEPKWFNGPYQIRSNSPSLLVLERNPYFWEKGKIFFDQIAISMIADPDVAFADFEKGESDWVGEPISLISPSTIKSSKLIKYQETNRFYWLYLNTQSPPLSSPNVRQALSLALDRKYICDHILLRDAPMYAPLPDAWSQVKPIVENLELAKKLFDREISSLTLSFCPTSGGEPFARYLKECWETAFGITVHLEESEWNLFRSCMEKGDFQIGGCWGTPTYDDPMSLLERFAHLSVYNFSQWSHAEYREKIELARITPSKRLLEDAERILIEEMPFIPISHHPHLYAHHPQLKGFYIDRFGCVDFRDAFKES